MPGMLMAARAGNRMQTRQMMRTANRMNRRREMWAGGSSQDQYAEPAPQQYAQPQYVAPPPAAEPAYVVELERLAQLHQQGVLSTEEYEAKKRQVLGL